MSIPERYWLYKLQGGGILNALKSIRKVLDSCKNRPVIVVGGGLWYRWVLERLGIKYFNKSFGDKSRIEKWFRKLKERTKRFYNNVNSKTLRGIEEIVIAILRNIKVGGKEIIPA